MRQFGSRRFFKTKPYPRGSEGLAEPGVKVNVPGHNQVTVPLRGVVVVFEGAGYMSDELFKVGE